MTATINGGLTEAGLAAAFAGYADSSGFLIAVSGGPDSMALLRLVADWAARNDHPPIHAATVDHRLRPDSSAEAKTVALWAEAAGVPHAILNWDGEKPTTRIQERARTARYGLLAAHAERVGANVLMTAHHADDQVETILFRLLRGSAVAGLAGMAPVAQRGKLRHVRPLLGCTKVELVAFCEAAGQPFFRDPSNEDPRYARTRMRRLSALLAEQGFGRNAILRLAGRLARAEAALAGQTRAAQAELAAVRTAGSFAAQTCDLAQLADEIILRILICEVERIGERPHAPRLERAEALLARLLPALRADKMFAGTLGGTKIRLDRGRLTIETEGRRHSAQRAQSQPHLGLTERKMDSSRREDRPFPWQGTL